MSCKFAKESTKTFRDKPMKAVVEFSKSGASDEIRQNLETFHELLGVVCHDASSFTSSLRFPDRTSELLLPICSK